MVVVSGAVGRWILRQAVVAVGDDSDEYVYWIRVVGTDTIGLQLDVTVTGGFDAGSGRLLNLLLAMAVSW